MMRPTAYIHIVVRENQATEETYASLKRSYAYIAPVTFDAGQSTEIILRVKLSGHPYWDSSDSAQNETWNETLLPWLQNKLNKVQNTIEAYNNENARSFCGALPIDRITLVLEPLRITFEMNDDRFPDIIALLEELRGALAKEESTRIVQSVYAPWPSSQPDEAGTESREAASALPEPWEITFTDGGTRLYDPATKTWQ